VQRTIAQIPWRSNIALLDRLESAEKNEVIVVWSGNPEQVPTRKKDR
jgi:hypothetical protein